MSSTFNNTITQLLTTTPNHADNFNNINSKLLENTKHNKENIDNLTEKVSEIEADTIQINNQIDTLNSKDTELDNKINVLSDDGKISKKGQIYNGYKGRYFSDIFPNGTSLDDVRTNVFCHMQGSDNVPNLPNGLTSANSCLEVQTSYLTDGTPYTTKQTFTRINVGSWVRFYSGADKVWTDWEPIATTEKTEILLLNGYEAVDSGRDELIVARSGNICNITGRIINRTTAPNGIVVGVLDEQYRPKKYRRAFVHYEADSKTVSCEIKPNGDITIYDNTVAINKGFRFNITYCIEQ